MQRFCLKNGIVLATSSRRYPASNGLAGRAVILLKDFRKKCEDKNLALAAYRATPLPSGYSPSNLIFGRPIRSNLGVCYDTDIDYGQFEYEETKRKRKIKDKFDIKSIGQLNFQS